MNKENNDTFTYCKSRVLVNGIGPFTSVMHTQCVFTI